MKFIVLFFLTVAILLNLSLYTASQLDEEVDTRKALTEIKDPVRANYEQPSIQRFKGQVTSIESKVKDCVSNRVKKAYKSLAHSYDSMVYPSENDKNASVNTGFKYKIVQCCKRAFKLALRN